MRRNQLTWMAAVLGTVALTGMVGCGKGKTANLGAASISVGAAKLTLVDVKSVTVTISGGISTPLTVPLVGSGSQYSALVSDLPVGTNYTFTASAKNASSVEIYHGAATGVATATDNCVGQVTATTTDPLTYTAAGLPRGATLNARTGLFSWTPDFGELGGERGPPGPDHRTR